MTIPAMAATTCRAQRGATLIVALIILLLSSLAASVAVTSGLTQERITAASRERTRAQNDSEAKLLDAQNILVTYLQSTPLVAANFPILRPSATNWHTRIDYLGNNHTCTQEISQSRLEKNDPNQGSRARTCARFRIITLGTSGAPNSPAEYRVEYFYEVTASN